MSKWNFKNLLFVDSDNPTPQTVEQKPQTTVSAVQINNPTIVQTNNPTIVQTNNVPLSSFSKDGKVVGNIDSDIMSKLCVILDEANIEGPDYQELKSGADQMAIAGIADPGARMIAAFIGLKVGYPSLTKKHVLDSIDFYVQTIENERQVGLEQLALKRKTNVEDKKTSIQGSVNAIADMKKQIEELQKQINTMTTSINTTNNEIILASRECDQKEADFNRTIDEIINILRTDKQQIITVLPE